MVVVDERVKWLDSIVLDVGSHSSIEEGVCVLEAVAYVAGEEFSDDPKCASPVLGAFLRSWNDSMNEQDRQKLKPYIPRLVGTATSEEDEETRAWLVTDWLVRTFTPAWLRKAGLDEHAERLEQLDALTSPELAEKAQPIIEDARKAAAAAWDAARDAAGDAPNPRTSTQGSRRSPQGHRCRAPSLSVRLARPDDRRRKTRVTGRAFADRTHCRHGHPLDEANTRYEKTGRRCRACDRRKYHDYVARRKAVAGA